MITEQQQEQACLYALGALPETERLLFEADLRRDEQMQAFARPLQTALECLALAIPQTPLPVALRDKVLGKIGQGSTAPGNQATSRPDQAAPGTPHPPSQVAGFRLDRAFDASGWKQLPVSGAWIKLLSFQPDRGYAVLLGKLEPGVRYPAHTHAGPEDLYILSGDLHVGENALGPGDFHHADAGTAHDVNYSVEGCTLLAVLPAEHELVRFAMA